MQYNIYLIRYSIQNRLIMTSYDNERAIPTAIQTTNPWAKGKTDLDKACDYSNLRLHCSN